MSSETSYNVSNKQDQLNGFMSKQGTIQSYNNKGVDNLALDTDPSDNGGKAKVEKLTRSFSKISTASQKSKTRFSDNGDDNPRSWWYAFCLKCRSKESTPESWEPQYWSLMCPYPFCPPYQSVSRILGLIVIGVVSWCILYTIIGKEAAPPSGQLFQLILLVLASKLGGWIFSLTTLPGLIGQLFTGIIIQNLHIVNIDSSFNPITKQLRKLALVVILIRAGLDLEPSALKRLKWSVVKLGLLPWLIEAAIVAVASKFFLSIPWDYGCALGSIAAAVSPAVTVVCLLRLRAKGYGVTKGIPTLIIAIAGIDDAASVAGFGIIEGAMFSTGSLTSVILQAPISVIGGIGFGIFWGLLCYYTPEKNDPYVAPLRIVTLLVGCTISVFGSDYIGYGGAGPLGCVTAAFTALVVWTKQGWDVEDNPASEGFEILWLFLEPILFSITGAQIKFNELDANVIYIGIGILVLSSAIRIAGTIILGIGCGLNLKEKLFASVALMAKATVQAALGPVLLSRFSDSASPEYEYAQKVLMVSIISIILTAPVSAIFMTVMGPRMLTRTKAPFNAEGLRRSVRSLRDLVVTDDKGVNDGEKGNVDEEKDQTKM